MAKTHPDDTQEQPAKLRDELDLIAVKDITVFPHLIIPLMMNRARSIKALDEAMANDRVLVLAAQKDPRAEQPAADEIYRVGTAVLVLQVLKLPEGATRLVVQGLSRVKITEITRTEPAFRARIEPLEEPQEAGDEAQTLMRVIVDQFKQSIELGKYIPPDMLVAAVNIKDPGHLADVITFHLDLVIEDRQKVLETVDVLERLKLVCGFQSREIEILRLESQIQSKARKEMDKGQREYYLRQQLKAIQDELGMMDDEKEETRILAEEVDKAGMPDEVKETALKELKKLERMPPSSAERTVTRTYLDWLIEFPWSKSTEDRLDLKGAQAILDEDHYGLKDVKERILEFLAVRSLSKNLKAPIFCFVGPPGVGKTSLGRSIARTLGRKFIRISLGGVRDEAEIRGHRRTYIGSLPGRIIQAISKAQSRNPVFMMDEIDKMGMDFRGDPSAALLEALDPEQNNSFKDHYLEVPVDLSQVFFILTCNMLDTIPPALRDRMEVIRLPGYTEDEKIHIASKFLFPKQMDAHGLKGRAITMTPAALHRIIREYTREAGIRQLDRHLATICRKLARLVAEKTRGPRRISPERIQQFLGVPRFGDRDKTEAAAVGSVKGLSWTEHGGEVLTVEAGLVKGRGNLVLTGSLGDVMKESAMTALSYVRSRCQPAAGHFDYYRNDIHVHVPEGAIPKDGPSAGITMATAIYSAITDKPVRADVAMTGEITLRGKVLAIGGLKEKVLAAHREEISTIIMPQENAKNLEEIPEPVRRAMKFIFVSHVDEVLEVAFKHRSAKKQAHSSNGRDRRGARVTPSGRNGAAPRPARRPRTAGR